MEFGLFRHAAEEFRKVGFIDFGESEMWIPFVFLAVLGCEMAVLRAGGKYL